MALFIDALIKIEDAIEPLTVLEVVREPQEGRYYYVTTFTKQDQERYFTTNPLTYMGRYIGSRKEGWGIEHREWSHFVNEKGEEVVINHKPQTAFYHIKHIPVLRMPPDYNLPQAISLPPAILTTDLVELMSIQANQICDSCKKVRRRNHVCSNKEAYLDLQPPKEYLVVRIPVVGKYYEATFWDRKEGHWSNETHYSNATTKREYVGQYLRTRSEGWGDGADYWGIFLRDGKEIEIEYDYDGKRAFYEVEPK